MHNISTNMSTYIFIVLFILPHCYSFVLESLKNPTSCYQTAIWFFKVAFALSILFGNSFVMLYYSHKKQNNV